MEEIENNSTVADHHEHPAGMSKGLIILLLILFVLSTGVSVFILTQQTNKDTSAQVEDQQAFTRITDEPSPYPTLKKKVSPTPTLTSKDTSLWNQFSNVLYGYSFKYPADWTFKRMGQLEPKILDYVVFNPADATSSARSITVSYSTRSYNEVLSLGATTQEDITVDSVKSARKVERNSDGETSISVIIPFSNNTIIFYAQEQYNDILSTLLSTFKFTK